jgi:two-component system LytT family response regulator
MLRAVIIDDEENAVVSLELLLKLFVPEISLIGSCSDPREGVELINDSKPDIVFLDVNMPHLNGFDVLQKLSFHDFHLIFTTAHQQFAIKALREDASWYLLKPIDTDEFVAAIEKIKRNISENKIDPAIIDLLDMISNLTHKKINLPSKYKIELVEPSQIQWIEADSNDCKVCLTNNEITIVFRSLKDFEAQLCKSKKNFIRVHNSFIVNMDHVDKYIKEDHGHLVMKDNKKIPLSKQKKQDFLRYIVL